MLLCSLGVRGSGLHTASEYRSDIEQSQVTAQEYYEGAELQAQLAAESAQEAADSASAAQEAVTSAEAAEAAAAAQAAADAAAAAAAAAAAEAAAKQGGSTGSAAYGSYPSGTKVPFNKSDDPENAAGGDYDVNACASKSASTVNGVPVCD